MITHYSLNKDGTILEDGTEIYSEQVFTAKTKKEIIRYAKDNKFDPDYYFLQAEGYELINGIKVPETFGEPEFLNIFTESK